VSADRRVSSGRGLRDLASLVLVPVLVLFAGCTGAPPDGTRTLEPGSPTTTATRDYWPTSGWRTAAPQDHGIGKAQLAQVEVQLSKGYPHVRSVLIVRHGYVVYEHYRKGLTEKSGHDVRSVTKGVIGALIGICLGQGKIKSVDQPVLELLAGHVPGNADPRFARVTIRHLLTMTAGLAADDPGSGPDPKLEEELWESADWVRHILGRPLESEPGTHFAYSDADAHLLSAIVADTCGLSTLTYARGMLFDRLGIRTDEAFEPRLGTDITASTVAKYEQSSVAWPVDPQGYHYGAALLRLPARDLAKFGYLYLNGGRWDGEQVIPADYVAAATSPSGSSPSFSNGYGWLWWVGTEGGRTFYARGYGGQLIYVVPDKDLVVVVTSDPEAGGLDPRILITQTILPAIA
jgi:CubicO group peptidase (beta-lactamase class C family)